MSDPGLTLKRAQTAHHQFMCMQVELQKWMGQVLEDQNLFESNSDFSVSLRDGRILCRLMNKIRPGCIAKEPTKTQAAFKMMEYVSWFAIAAVNYGVEFVFLPSDLVSGNNMMSVLATLYELAELAHSRGEAPGIEKIEAPTKKGGIEKKALNRIKWAVDDKNKANQPAAPGRLLVKTTSRSLKDGEGSQKTTPSIMKALELRTQKLERSTSSSEDVASHHEVKESTPVSITSPTSSHAEPTVQIPTKSAEISQEKPEVKVPPPETPVAQKFEPPAPVEEPPAREVESPVARIIEPSQDIGTPETIADKEEEIDPLANVLDAIIKESKEDKEKPEGKTEEEKKNEIMMESSDDDDDNRKERSISNVSTSSVGSVDNDAKNENFRVSVIKEIVSTEQAYVKHLRIIVNTFIDGLKYNNIVDEQTISSLFSNVRELEVLNSKLLARLQDRIENSSSEYWMIGDIFLEMADQMAIYSIYCTNKDQSGSLYLKLFKENSSFQKWVKDMSKDTDLNGLGLQDFLVKPVQRICRYPLLLKELLRYTKDYHVDYEQLVLAHQQMEQLTSMVNESKRYEESFAKIHQVANLLGMSELTDSEERMFIKEGELIAMLDGKSTKARSFTFFLFSDLLVFAKASRFSKRHSMSSKNRPAHMSFKGKMFMSEATIQSWNDATYIKYGWQLVSASGVKLTLGAQTQAEKDSWIKALNEVIYPNNDPKQFRRLSTSSPSFSVSPEGERSPGSLPIGKSANERSSRQLIRQSFASLNAAQLAKDEDAETWAAASQEAIKEAQVEAEEEQEKLDSLNEWKKKFEEEIKASHNKMLILNEHKEGDVLIRTQQRKELTQLKEQLVTLKMQMIQMNDKGSDNGKDKKGGSSEYKKVMHDTNELTKQLNQERKARRELSLWKDEYNPKMEELQKKTKLEIDTRAKLQEKYDKLRKTAEKKSKK
ncbi:calmodulin-binding protein [Planoprotostelium fungivorum]|uniref:Calmodulin-binding protein n=1 Tax=Planoprotostelium fungivorum TaxID=1890364 RepID=A0A2P6NI91_9EUKA|nr:calmodulin-binding protein [Planoprotostelium fungivorum]